MLALEILWVTIPALTSLVYGALLYTRMPQWRDLEPAERWRVLFLLAATVWSLASMLLHAGPFLVDPIWFVRVVAATNFALPLTLYGFTVHFLALRRAKRLLTLGEILYLPIAGLLLFGPVIYDVEVHEGMVTMRTSPVMRMLGLYWMFYMYSAAYYVARERLRTINPEFRQRLDYLLTVVLLLIVGNTLNITPLVAYPMDILLGGVAAVFMTLSITRAQLLAVRQTVIRVVVLAVITLAYLVSVAVGLYTMEQLSQTALLIASVVVAAVSLLLMLSIAPIRRRVYRLAERIFLEQLDWERISWEISRLGTRLRLPGEVGRDILHVIRQALQVESAALVLKQELQGGYRVVAQVGLDDAEELVFAGDSPLVQVLSQLSEAITIEQLAEHPLASGLWIEEWDALYRLQAEVIVPIFFEKEFIGFFTLGRRKGQSVYSRQDLRRSLPMLANQIAIVLNNSLLYAEVQAKAEELARANEELQELDKMKTEIIQNVSHELRTPLTLIMGYAELLGEGILSSPVEVREAGRLIEEHAEHLKRLVEQLLAFQRLERSAMEIKPFDVRDWLEEVIKAWQPALNKAHLSLRAHIDENVGYALGNTGYLRQVLDNLLDNARKFSPTGGTITLRAWREDDTVYISVQDEGIGVPPEKLPRLFDRFYQVDGSPRRRYGGMGIGLALCKEIVDRHGGRIWAESEGVGKGLTVTFTLQGGVSPLIDENSSSMRVTS